MQKHLFDEQVSASPQTIRGSGLPRGAGPGPDIGSRRSWAVSDPVDFAERHTIDQVS